jgi:hypothetical protein
MKCASRRSINRLQARSSFSRGRISFTIEDVRRLVFDESSRCSIRAPRDINEARVENIGLLRHWRSWATIFRYPCVHRTHFQTSGDALETVAPADYWCTPDREQIRVRSIKHIHNRTVERCLTQHTDSQSATAQNAGFIQTMCDERMKKVRIQEKDTRTNPIDEKIFFSYHRRTSLWGR